MFRARSVGNSGQPNNAIQLAKDLSYVDLGLFRVYIVLTAIVDGTTAVPSGARAIDLVRTTHATGAGKIFANVAGVCTSV